MVERIVVGGTAGVNGAWMLVAWVGLGIRGDEVGSGLHKQKTTRQRKQQLHGPMPVSLDLCLENKFFAN